MMETLTTVGILLGALALAAGVLMLAVNVFRRRALKKWALVAGAGFLVAVVMGAISPTPLEPREDSDGVDASKSATKPCGDCIEFGVGEDPTSDVLALVEVSKTFAQDTDLWLRVRLKKSAGSVKIEYFLQQQREGPGWSTLNSWASNVDPDSNIFREWVPALQSLDPSDYKVFVLIGDEKRAEGFFTIMPAPALAESTPLRTPPGTTPDHQPTTTPLPNHDSTEATLSRDSCALFLIGVTTIEPRGLEVMKDVADQYAPGMTLELVVWFSGRLDTIPTSNVDIVNFAKMLALVRDGAIPSIQKGDYYTLRNKYDVLDQGDADTISREIIGDGSLLDERFGRIDATNIQIQIDIQKEQGIAYCANLDQLAPVSATVALPLDGFALGKCDRAILFYSERMEIITGTSPGIDGERRATVTLSFKKPQPDTYEPRLIATLQKAGESIAESCVRP